MDVGHPRTFHEKGPTILITIISWSPKAPEIKEK